MVGKGDGLVVLFAPKQSSGLCLTCLFLVVVTRVSLVVVLGRI